MNRTERLEAALKHEETDRPPFSFWYPFGLQHMDAAKIADAYISFWKEFKPDFLKVGCNYPFPPAENINLSSSLENLRQEFAQGAIGECWKRNLSILGTIAAFNKTLSAGDQFWTTYTILSPWTILRRLCNEDEIFKTLTLHHEYVKDALDIIAQATIPHIKDAIDCGIQGIYFVMTEADYEVLNPLQHEALCKDINQEVLKAAESLKFNILNIKGSRTYFTTMTDYKVQCVSWNHFRTKLGLAKGQKEWGKNYCIIGGINHEVLHSMPSSTVKKFFDRHRDEFSMPGLIVAPPASLSHEVSLKTLHAVKDSLENLHGKASVFSDRRHTSDGGYIKAELRHAEAENYMDFPLPSETDEKAIISEDVPESINETNELEVSYAAEEEPNQVPDNIYADELPAMPREAWKNSSNNDADRYDLNNHRNQFFSEEREERGERQRRSKQSGASRRNDKSSRSRREDRQTNRGSRSYRDDRSGDRRDRPYRDGRSDDRRDRPYRDDRSGDRRDRPFRDDRSGDRRDHPYRDSRSGDRRDRPFRDSRSEDRRDRPFRDARPGDRRERSFREPKRNDRPDNRLRTGKRIRITPNR